jgi:CheY-like chemotaxis protein
LPLLANNGAGTECILVAEDQGNVRDMVSEMLRARGYSVLTASDGLKALEISGSHSGPIQLLLTDIVMPGLNGKSLYEKVKASRKDIKVLFMSGYTNNLLGGEIQPSPGVDFIQKPFTLDKLLVKLRGVLDSTPS